MESWSYFTAWSYNEIGASKKSSTNLTNDTIYSGSKGMATGWDKKSGLVFVDVIVSFLNKDWIAVA